jgi:DNA-binding response OmpR family regulator
MSKRILLAEESSTIRDLAESLLRQNGIEVLSVTSGEKAMDVLNYARPDLIIMASEIKFRGHIPLYEHLQESLKASSIPILILANQNESGLPFPEEVIIPKPFNPKEFMERVNILTGAAESIIEKPSNPDPVSMSNLENEMIDNALGVDNLNITDSEEMKAKEATKTTQIRRDAKMLGIDDNSSKKNLIHTGKVESLMIRDEHGEITQPEEKDSEEDENLSESNKLEILNDQFGLIDPIEPDQSLVQENHDYNWFLNELKKETEMYSDLKPQLQETPIVEKPDDEELSFEEPSTHITPVQPANVKPNESKKESVSSGVDSFIDEFKKEMDKISSSDEPETFTIKEDQTESDKNVDLKWQDSAEKITPENIDSIKERIVSEITDKITRDLLNQIDSDELIEMMKKEIVKKIKKEE